MSWRVYLINLLFHWLFGTLMISQTWLVISLIGWTDWIALTDWSISWWMMDWFLDWLIDFHHRWTWTGWSPCFCCTWYWPKCRLENEAVNRMRWVCPRFNVLVSSTSFHLPGFSIRIFSPTFLCLCFVVVNCLPSFLCPYFFVYMSFPVHFLSTYLNNFQAIMITK